MPPLLDDALLLDELTPVPELDEDVLDEEEEDALVLDVPPAPSCVVTVPPHAVTSAAAATKQCFTHACIRDPQYPASFFKRK
jgi:hypothetical protein